MATLIKVDGTKVEITQDTFSLEDLQNFVGGYIQRIQLFDGRAMYMNEEGKFANLSENKEATFLCDLSGIAMDDFVVGDVIILSEQEENS